LATIAFAAIPTLFMQYAVNQYGSIAPRKRKLKVMGRRTLMITCSPLTA